LKFAGTVPSIFKTRDQIAPYPVNLPNQTHITGRQFLLPWEPCLQPEYHNHEKKIFFIGYFLSKVSYRYNPLTQIALKPPAMKNIYRNPLPFSFLILLFAAFNSISAQNNVVVINGQLKDAKTEKNISHATITVPNTGIGTVSNSQGEFTLKINSALNAEYFEISHLSYATTQFKISEATGKEQTFYLQLRPINLNEISILPGDARTIVMMALNNIKKNYSEVPVMMTGFYRESIRQRRDYLSISEAVVDIYNASYSSFQNDQVKIFKGRKGSNVKKADTLMVQMQGGPHVSMLLDIVKNTNLSIALDNLDNYLFEFQSVTTIDDKPNWVIAFSPYLVREEPLYYGKLYIAQEDYAVTRAEFSLDLTDQEKASRVFVQKKPMGLLFHPTSTSYLVTYKEQDNKYHLNYVRVELKFRCDWKRRLFKNNYALTSELAITDWHTDKIVKFTNQEVFKSNMVFTETVHDMADVNFWGESNIIEPENSIENAIKKLSKSMKKQP